MPPPLRSSAVAVAFLEKVEAQTDKPTYSVAELCEELGCARQTIWRKARDGGPLKRARTASREVHVTRGSLLRWLRGGAR